MRAGILAAVLGAALLSVAGPAPAVERFYYAAPYRAASGFVYTSPIVTAADQLTSRFPDSEVVDGVVLLLYWSAFEPVEGQYRHDLIDDVLDYWHARGRKVILNMAPVGHPIRVCAEDAAGMWRLPQSGCAYVNATPDWLMARVSAYSKPTLAIDHVKGEVVDWRFPRYEDPVYRTALKRMLSAIARRHDGSPALAAVRIPVGLLGEDNPGSDGLETGIPGFTSDGWIDHVDHSVRTARRVFRRTPLELDIVRLAWVAEESPVLSSRVEQLLDMARRDGIVLGHNGLRAESATLMARPPAQPNGHLRAIRMLTGYRQAGGRIVLEMVGPLQSPRTADLSAIMSVVGEVQPGRVVMFGSAASLANFRRVGRSAINEAGVSLFAGEVPDAGALEEKAAGVEAFLAQLRGMGQEP